MLLALGVKPYKGLRVHGYWLMNALKMSKTIGNVVRPLEIKEKFGLENLRYYLLREMSFGLDSSFSLEAFIQTSNAALANGIGNLTSRVLTLCTKNNVTKMDASKLTDADRAFLTKRSETLKVWNESFEDLKYQNALRAWSELVTACDLYINDNKPWALAKDVSTRERLEIVLGCAMNVIEGLAIIGMPALPNASKEILKALGKTSNSLSQLEKIDTEFKLTGEVPKLFARLEMPKEEAPAK